MKVYSIVHKRFSLVGTRLKEEKRKVYFVLLNYRGNQSAKSNLQQRVNLPSLNFKEPFPVTSLLSFISA
jgi:hypothetical protein